MRDVSATFGAGLLLLLLTGQAGAQSAGPVKLVPHRAVYDLSLAASTGSRGVESARGRIAFDFGGDACEGYTLKFRQVTVLEGGESGTRTSDLRSTTYEAGDGSSLRFHTENSSNSGADKTVDGTAERRNGGIAVRLKEPAPASFTLPPEPLFPTAHMRRLIELARAGERTLSIPVYDGSDDGRKVYDTLAVIGNRIEPGAGANLEPPTREKTLADSPRWPVTLSYFAPGDGERTPIYVLSFELYENGVSRALKLDYGEFAIRGELKSVDAEPLSACAK